jgi:hypothetical protein
MGLAEFGKFQIQFGLNLFCSKDALLELKKIQIKYGAEVFEIRNKFPYWKVSRFAMEFE